MIPKIRLGDLVEITNGYAFKSSEYDDSGVRVIRITNVQKGSIVDNNPQFYPLSSQSTLNRYSIIEGDILMSLTGNVGRVGRFPRELLPAYINQRVCRVKSRSLKLSNDYLFYVLNSDFFERDAIENSAGVAQLNLSTKWIEDYKIPLPALAEQQKIAAILDAADSLKQKDQQLVERYTELSQSLFLEMFGDPVTNPMGWALKSIDKLVQNKKGAIKRGPFGGALKKEIFVDDGFLVYEQFHALNNDFTMARYFINEKKFTELKDFEVKPDDIIISCSGVNLGRLAIVPENARRGIINQALLRLSLNFQVMSNAFFIFIFTNKNFKEKYFGGQRGSGVPNFPPISAFKQFEFICPPVELQNQFAERIQVIEGQKQQAQRSLEKSEALFNSLLQRAFTGELTSKMAA